MAPGSAVTALDTGNARVLQEKLELVQTKLGELHDRIDRYEQVSDTIAELPHKLEHKVMVPLGKRAMMPGVIVRSNEILAHLGDEYFAWQPASQAIETIKRKQKNLNKQVKEQEEALVELTTKKSEADSFLNLKKLYEEENIKEITETEQESEQHPVVRATEEDVQEFFEIEEEERLKNEQAEWNWDDVMKRVEELEASEERGDSVPTDDAVPEVTPAMRATELKAKGNDAFAKRKFKESLQFYSEAISCDPSSHILYGNRAAAYHRLKKYEEALKDADLAIELCDSWVKGHYRRACALSALKRYKQAAEAFERAFELCPTDAKLEQQAQEMRRMALNPAQPKPKPVAATVDAKKKVTFASSVEEKEEKPAAPRASPFSGNILERPPTVHSASSAVATPELMPGFPAKQSRFQGNNEHGDVVRLEPQGEAQPVKRVSRFKAARAAQQQQ